VVKLWASVQAFWRQARSLADAEVVVVAELMGGVPLDAALAAVKARAARGDVHPPNPGEIVADVQAAAGGGRPWADVMGLLRRSCSRPTTDAGAIAWLHEQDPAVAAWAEHRGYRSIVRSNVDDPVFGPRIEADLRVDFERFVAARPALATRTLDAGAATRRSLESGRP
jgi:hypothetical protein